MTSPRYEPLREKVSGRRAMGRGNETLGYTLTNGGVLLIFLCYPSITQTVFKFFQVQTFDEPYGTFMMADYSIDANGGAYGAVMPYAIAMIFIWPIGVPFIIGLLLFRARRALLEIRRRERLMGGIYDGERWNEYLAKQRRLGLTEGLETDEPVVDGFLWSLTEAYRGTVFYFEVIEYLLQKLTLVGLLVFYEPGEGAQATFMYLPGRDMPSGPHARSAPTRAAHCTSISLLLLLTVTWT